MSNLMSEKEQPTDEGVVPKAQTKKRRKSIVVEEEWSPEDDEDEKAVAKRKRKSDEAETETTRTRKSKEDEKQDSTGEDGNNKESEKGSAKTNTGGNIFTDDALTAASVSHRLVLEKKIAAEKKIAGSESLPKIISEYVQRSLSRNPTELVRSSSVGTTDRPILVNQETKASNPFVVREIQRLIAVSQEKPVVESEKIIKPRIRRRIVRHSNVVGVDGQPDGTPQDDAALQNQPNAIELITDAPFPTTMIVAPQIDFSEPARPPTGVNSFNVSEIIKDFLYVGAGFDERGRCVTNFPGDDISLVAERAAWFDEKNVRFALNMAGSPLQVELKGMSYPSPAVRALSLDVNDLETWEPNMEPSFDNGAAFIHQAALAHLSAKQDHSLDVKPPAIFVHCVAGVNRSPFVVIWWLVKYCGFSVEESWEMVRNRRDVGVAWKDETLGGRPRYMGEASPLLLQNGPTKDIVVNLSSKKPPKQAWYDSTKAKFAEKIENSIVVAETVPGEETAASSSSAIDIVSSS